MFFFTAFQNEEDQSDVMSLINIEKEILTCTTVRK